MTSSNGIFYAQCWVKDFSNNYHRQYNFGMYLRVRVCHITSV